MYKKQRLWRKCLSILLLVSLVSGNFSVLGGVETAKAADSKINIPADGISAKNANGHGAQMAVDGDTTTYWQSIPSNGEGDTAPYNRMYDHNRYIDIKLDGTYQLSLIKIFNLADGSYNNYYVYASKDGVNYDKIISKTSDTPASAEGDSHTVNVEASYLRLNMAYNSDRFVTNLSEIEVYGSKLNDTVLTPAEITVEDWEGSKWQEEWNKFENDKTYANQKVITEMGNLVGRVIGEKWKSSFRFEMRNSLEADKDIFEIKDGENDTIIIRGNNGLAMASGFNYYLRNYVNIDYNPLYGSNTNLKEIKPVGKRIVKEAQFDLRYALNFCTYSYTMSFWNWDEYEEFLDWSAMNGINLILDIVGQEEVLRQTFREFNFTDEEIKDYICGPAYFAWFYMQNLYSIGGPLPNSWFEQRTELGRQIHDRMQTYGISPVIQGFGGQVPETFAEKNEGAVLTPTDGWSGFTRPSIIKTYLTAEETAAGKKNYFSDAAEVFYEKQKNVFGDVSHYYAVDPFHEGGNTGGLDVGNIYGEVQKEMLKSDAEAIWVMQQWQGNLDANKMSQLDTKKTLPLDLQADMNPQHGLFEQNGSPWIYCMLHNFGGRMGLDGEVPVIAVDPIETYQNTNNMVGIGMTPEAMENGPAVYELLFDTNWSKDPINYREWMKTYGERRAGGTSDSLNQAWKILLNTAYADKGIYYQGAAETVINTRPSDSFNAASTWGHSNILYDKKELDKALLLLIENYEAFAESEAYKYDLADVAEQVICNAAVEYHKLMVQAKNAGNLEEFTKLSTAFLGMIELSDQILSTTDEFMLGTWVEAARKMITDADDWTKDLFEFNARALVTTWGGERVGSLKDYSNRKWSGLTKTFYKERWEIWVRNRIAELKGLKDEEKNPADLKAERNWFLWEFQWVNRKSDDEDGKYSFETTPSDADLAALAEQAYEKYSYTNLEKNTGGSAQEIVNIAKDKPVSVGASQTAADGGSPANLTDGNTETGWKAEGAGPHTMTIDLEGSYQVSGVVISIQQLAKEFPYTWKLEYFNPDTSEWEMLDGNEDAQQQIMIATTEIFKECTASQIRLTVTTADVTDSPVEVKEIVVNGTELEEGETFENLALGIEPTTNQETSSDSNLSMLTDGNLNNLWKTAGNNYPVTVEIDLPRTSYVDNVDVYFEKAGLPFEFKVKASDENNQEVFSYTEQSSHGNVLENRSYKIDVKKEIKKVTVTLLRSTGQGTVAPGAWPALSEILVMGTPSAALENLALGIEPKVNRQTSSDSSLSMITDGNVSNLWKTAGNDYPVTIEIDLPQTSYVDNVEVYFEKAGLPFQFKVTASDEKNEEVWSYTEQSSHDNVLENQSYKAKVLKEVKKVTVTLLGSTGKGEFSGVWPALSEIMVVGEPPEGGEEDDTVDLSNSPVTGISVSGGNATGNVLDGDRDNTFDRVEKEAEIVFDLGKVYYLSHVNFVFEKGELGLNYQVFAEDAAGQRITLSDQSGSSGTLGDKTVRVPVNGNIKKVIFKHLGNNGSGPAYAAEFRLYEFEAFGVAKSESSITAVPTEAGVLLNGSADYTVAADGTVELTLEKAYDLNMVSVTRALDETKALKYKVEYLDLETETWELFADLTQNCNTKSSISFAVAAKSVFAQKLKLTFPEEIKLSGIQVYNTDYAGMLSDRISYIEGILAVLTYGDAYGSYQAEAKAKLESVLSEAKEAQGVNSQTIDEWLEKVNAALEEFYDTGAVFVERDELLAAMADAVDLMEKLKVYGMTSQLEAVKESYQTARAAYEVYGASQTQIQTAKSALSSGIQETAELVETIVNNPELSEARIEFCQYLNGLEERLEENYTPESWENYQAALSAAEAVLNNAQAQITAISDAKRQLEQAIENLTLLAEHPVERIVVSAEDNKTELTEGEIVQLFAEITPDNAEKKDVEWTSSAPAIASVDSDGLVTSHKQGTVKITAKATDGSNVTGEITLTIKKHVPGEPIKVQRITVHAEDDKTELSIDETVQLTAAVLPETADNKAVEWSSGDPETASVDTNGLVRAKAAGDVEITATAKDGSEVTGKIMLTVKEDTSEGTTKVEQITVRAEDDKTELSVGETVQLIADVLPENADNKAVKWTSSDTDIASIGTSGLVRAKAAGDVEITATAKDGSKVTGKIELVIQETSSEKPVKPETITVSAKDGKTSLKIGESVQLTAVVNPPQAAQTVNWTSNAPQTVEVDENGLVSAKAAGEVEITAASKEDDTIAGTIKLKVLAGTGGNTNVNKPVLITAIKLSAAKTTLTVGSTVKVTAAITPTNAANKSLTFTSDNKAVATVNTSGLVTAQSAGTARITATAKDGSRKFGSIKLTVIQPEQPLPKVGDLHKEGASNFVITKSSASEKTVTFKKQQKKNAKTVVVPDTVEINGYTYQVTEIAAKAFKNNKKIKTVVIGSNIKKIGKQAFLGCKKLKTIKILSKSLKKIDKTVFKGIDKKATITVPKKKYKAYKNLLKKAKLPKTVKIKKK